MAALPTAIGESVSNAKDVILKHIDAFNGRDSDAEPWAADGELRAPMARVSGRDDIIGFFGVFWNAFPDVRLELHQLLADGTDCSGRRHPRGHAQRSASDPQRRCRRRPDGPSNSNGQRSTSPKAA